MASIKGQPSPKPQSVKSPVPAEVDQDFLNSFDQNDLDFQASFDGAGAEAVPELPPEVPFAGAIQTVADYLPAAGGIVGGMVGGTVGAAAGGVGAFPGAVGGAALGGAAGAAYRDIIETQILGRRPKESLEVATDIAKSGAVEGASQAAGGAIMKGLGKVGSKVLQYGDDAMKALKGAVSEARGTVEAPVTKLILEKTTALTPRESGDAVKNLIVNNIKGKYAPFVKAYSELDEIGSALPLKDEARIGLTQKIREWSASELGGDNARAVSKFAHDLDAADNGAKLRDVISQIGDARSAAYKNGATKLANTLKTLQEKANDFMEGETTKLASRIASGKAAPEEIGFITQALQTRGIQETNPTKYAQSIANDYLKSLRTVKKDYAGFRSFLEDVAEQTKTSTTKKGPVSFLDDITNVPSEKLMDRMFDPKNVKALELMKKETPEVFEEVSKARLKSLLEKSSPTGELDLTAFQKQVNKLPPDTRRLLFSPEELVLINKTAGGSKLKNLTSLEKKLDNKMFGYLQELSSVVGQKTPEAIKVPMRQAVGKPIVNTGAALLPRTVGTEGE